MLHPAHKGKIGRFFIAKKGGDKKMERKYGKEQGIVPVSFICPVGREFDAADVFEQLGLSLSSNFQETTRTLRTQDGTILQTRGFEFTGHIDERHLTSLIKSLSEKRIAGYSRETQIVAF